MNFLTLLKESCFLNQSLVSNWQKLDFKMWVEVRAGLWQSCPRLSLELLWSMKCWSSSPGILLTAPGTLQLWDKLSGGVQGRWPGRWKFSDLYSFCFLLCPPFGKKLLSPRWLLQCWHGLFELKIFRSNSFVGLLYPLESGISCQGGYGLDLTGEGEVARHDCGKRFVFSHVKMLLVFYFEKAS